MPLSLTPPDCTVGVVIPTVGRLQLARAIRSVLSQTYPPARIVIAVDGPVARVNSLALPVDPRIAIVTSQLRTGVSAMRNAGIQALDSHLVALLDDDDEWLPAKLERQVQAYVEAREQGVLHPIVAARVFIQDVAGSVVAIAPIDLCQPGQAVGDYLFRRKRIRRREAMLLPSTLLFDRALALEVPFDEALLGGEDRAWLLSVSVRSDTRIFHLHEPLARYTEHRGGKSRSLSWPASLAWLSAQEDVLSKTERAESMLCNVAPQALMAHDAWGFVTVLWRAYQLRAASWRAWFYICFAVFVYAAMDWCLARMQVGRQLFRKSWLAVGSWVR